MILSKKPFSRWPISESQQLNGRALILVKERIVGRDKELEREGGEDNNYVNIHFYSNPLPQNKQKSDNIVSCVVCETTQ